MPDSSYLLLQIGYRATNVSDFRPLVWHPSQDPGAKASDGTWGCPDAAQPYPAMHHSLVHPCTSLTKDCCGLPQASFKPALPLLPCRAQGDAVSWPTRCPCLLPPLIDADMTRQCLLGTYSRQSMQSCIAHPCNRSFARTGHGQECHVAVCAAVDAACHKRGSELRPLRSRCLACCLAHGITPRLDALMSIANEDYGF